MPGLSASKLPRDPKTELMLTRLFTVAEMLRKKTVEHQTEQPSSDEQGYEQTEVPIENHAPDNSMYSRIRR